MPKVCPFLKTNVYIIVNCNLYQETKDVDRYFGFSLLFSDFGVHLSLEREKCEGAFLSWCFYLLFTPFLVDLYKI